MIIADGNTAMRFQRASLQHKLLILVNSIMLVQPISVMKHQMQYCEMFELLL